MKAFLSRSLSIAAAVAALLGATAALEPPARAQARPKQARPSAAAATAKESPLSCDRLALSPAERKRHFQELGPALMARKTGVRALPDGYELRFPADLATLELLVEWSMQERRCCPFLDIALRLEREGGPLWLRLTGRAGTKEFIEADAGAWLKP